MSNAPHSMAEAERRIAEEAASRTGRLDLSNLGLPALPDTLFRLSHLRVLDLGAEPAREDRCPNAVDTQRRRLAELAGLEELLLDYSDLGGLEFAAGLRNLRLLDCSSTPVADLAPLASLTALQSLYCANTQVAELAPLAGLTALQCLDFSLTNVAELAPLAGLTALQDLDCSYTRIADLAPLAGLTALQSLHCSATMVAELAPILLLTKLQDLECRATRLTTLPANISALQSLKRLDLRENRLICVPASLGSLTALGANPGNPDHYGEGLHLEDNELDPPLPALIAPGQPEATRNVLAWLRGELDPETLQTGPAEPVITQIVRGPVRDFPELPAQGSGGYVILDITGAIAPAPPDDLDVDGNNLRRLRSLHPELCDLARTLRAALDRPNRVHEFLIGRIDAYLSVLDQPLADVPVELVFNAGVRLENAMVATRRQIAAKELPTLDLVADEAAESLLCLHGLFVLATRSGKEALDEAPRYFLTIEQMTELRLALSELVAAALDVPTIIRSEVSVALQANALEIGAGAHPERSSLVAAGMARNVAITTVAAGLAFTATAMALAALGPAGGIIGGSATLVAVEALKKSKAFAAVITPLQSYLDRAAASESADPLDALRRHREFVLRIEPILRRLAAIGGQFSFLNRALDRMRDPLPPPPP